MRGKHPQLVERTPKPLKQQQLVGIGISAVCLLLLCSGVASGYPGSEWVAMALLCGIGAGVTIWASAKIKAWWAIG